MKISRLKIIYVLLLVTLGVLLFFTIIKPMAPGSKYSEIQRESLLKSENGWVVQFDIMNHEGKVQDYIIQFAIDDDQPYVEKVLLQNQMSFTFVRRISTHEIERKKPNATFSVYKAGDDKPIEHITYNLD